MRSLNNTGITVPGGFRWFSEETKTWVPAHGSMPSYVDFIYACRQHSIANNLPMGLNWAQQIQDQICRGLDGEWCSEGGFPLPPAGGYGFTVEGVVQGSHKLARKMIEAKARRVPIEVSTKRASICLDCPYNQGPVGCSTCNQSSIDNAANTVDGGLSINDPRLKSCRISGLSLKAKINVPQEILIDVLTRDQKQNLPERCWLYQPIGI